MTTNNQQMLNEHFAEKDHVDFKLYLGNVENASTESVCGTILDVMKKFDSGQLKPSVLRQEGFGLSPKT